MPRPPASTPIRRTPGAPTNAVNMPIALRAAADARDDDLGIAAQPLGVLGARLVADHPLQVAHELRERMRARRPSR